MAKVRVIKRNFEAEALEKLQSSGSMLSMFAKELDVDLSKVPSEEWITIDTEKIAYICDPLPEEVGKGAFVVHMAYGGEKEVAINVKNEYFDELMKAWKEN